MTYINKVSGETYLLELTTSIINITSIPGLAYKVSTANYKSLILNISNNI